MIHRSNVALVVLSYGHQDQGSRGCDVVWICMESEVISTSTISARGTATPEPPTLPRHWNTFESPKDMHAWRVLGCLQGTHIGH